MKRQALEPAKTRRRVPFIEICCFMVFWPAFAALGEAPAPAPSQSPIKIGDRITKLKAAEGRVWSDATIVRIEPDCVTISTENGLARVPLDSVDASLRTRFGYDRSKAIQYREEREDAERKQIQEWITRQSQSTSRGLSPSMETRLAEANALGKKQAEARRHADEKSRATLLEFHSKRIAEENAAAARRVEAGEKTKARVVERERKKKEAAKKKK